MSNEAIYDDKISLICYSKGDTCQHFLLLSDYSLPHIQAPLAPFSFWQYFHFSVHQSYIYFFFGTSLFLFIPRMWLLLIGAIVVVSFTHWLYRWRNPKCNGKLPPGSMGFPLLGETLQFFAPNTSSDIPPFVRNRMDRFVVFLLVLFLSPHVLMERA